NDIHQILNNIRAQKQVMIVSSNFSFVDSLAGKIINDHLVKQKLYGKNGGIWKVIPISANQSPLRSLAKAFSTPGIITQKRKDPFLEVEIYKTLTAKQFEIDALFKRLNNPDKVNFIYYIKDPKWLFKDLSSREVVIFFDILDYSLAHRKLSFYNLLTSSSDLLDRAPTIINSLPKTRPYFEHSFFAGISSETESSISIVKEKAAPVSSPKKEANSKTQQDTPQKKAVTASKPKTLSKVELAEQIFNSLATASSQHTCRTVFSYLAYFYEQNEPTKFITIEEIKQQTSYKSGQIISALKGFAENGLIYVKGGSAMKEDSFFSMQYPNLFTEWSRISEWLQTERINLEELKKIQQEVFQADRNDEVWTKEQAIEKQQWIKDNRIPKYLITAHQIDLSRINIFLEQFAKGMPQREIKKEVAPPKPEPKSEIKPTAPKPKIKIKSKK
ncbi:MAG: hypothetical protein AAFO07_21955, partial [Bacteroidota bacterium]